MVTIVCAQCGHDVEKRACDVARAKGAMFCNKTCAGLYHRKGLSTEQIKENKRLYDIEYRRINFETRKVQKAAYFKANYNPEQAAIERKKTMARHVEYCRQPAYRAKKKVYDRQYRAKSRFGEFWEAYLMLLDVENEVDSRMDQYQIRLQNGTYNKTQRRHRHEQRINSEKSEGRALGYAERS